MQGGRKFVEIDWVRRMFLMVVFEFSFELFYCVENFKLLARSYTKNM
jgi:hypothetical protein